MRKIRVLIVDDSVVVRRVLSSTLSRDPRIEVVGTAPNGTIALAKIAMHAPELIILDIEMPDMDGLKMLTALRESHPFLPVILFSAFANPGAPAILDAGLAFAAVDYVKKCSSNADAGSDLRIIQEELLPKIKVHLQNSDNLEADVPSRETALPSIIPASQEPGGIDLVVVGVSTGGPKALAELLPCFPKDFPVPILIVQHMPSEFMKLLAERLAARSKIRVAAARSTHFLEPGQVWLARGDAHMVVENAVGGALIRIDKGPSENSCRPSVDVLFRTAAKVFGSRLLAVLMTGMGQDGFEGCKAVHKSGGQILVQDEASSVVWGMPRLVTQAGLVDQVLSLHDLGPEIIHRVMEPRNLVRATEPPVASR